MQNPDSSRQSECQQLLQWRRAPPPQVDEPLQRVQSNRTLLDIIREDQTSGFGSRRRDGRRSWRHLREKISLRRRGSGSAWSSTAPTPSTDHPLNSNSHRMTMTMDRPPPSNRSNSNLSSGESTQPEFSTAPGIIVPNLHRNPTGPVERPSGVLEHTSPLHGGANVEDEEQPVRTSLMALLAETDRQMGLEGSAYTIAGDEEEEEETTGGLNGVDYNNCCVCMVRHKGAAFIPCGHTFCRLCSRELWVQRGNCPLCNNYIVEILDIF
ncbi:RNA-binding protein MEX3B-like [Sesamum indicum]|uniref:RNA-binding protein MEX3B-like n=1 Tax=Sesamum indicum TaxID=4182 RepID=A0A6I9TRV0_SESIN|nr:RNA-binding protein MEX3B-like [Sesamum indicum]